MVKIEHTQGGHSVPVEPEPPADDNKTVDNEALEKNALEEAEAALAASSADDPDRAHLLDRVACAIDDCHNTLGVQGAGRLPEAIEYAKEALELIPEDFAHSPFDPDGNYDGPTWGKIFKNRGTIWNTLQTIHRDLYMATKDVKYLQEGISYGYESVEHTLKHRECYPQFLFNYIYGRRTHVLGVLYKLRFDHPDPAIGGQEQDLDNALVMQGRAADHTPMMPESYWRFALWCDAMVIKSGLRRDVQYINGALSLRDGRPRKLIDPSEGDIENRCQNNYYEYSRLLARKWQMTGDNEDFETLIEESREMVTYELSLGQPRKYIDDASSTRDVLRACAYSWYSDLMDDESEWTKHLPTIDTAIALYMKLLDLTPVQEDGDAIFRRDRPVGDATSLMTMRWHLTKSPAHGFALDDMNVHSATHNCIMQTPDPQRSCMDRSVKNVACGTSAAMDTNFSVFDQYSTDIGQPRLLFLDPVSPETWIRKRNYEDGTVELGATEADTDVWEFLKNYSRSESEGVSASAGVDASDTADADAAAAGIEAVHLEDQDNDRETPTGGGQSSAPAT